MELALAGRTLERAVALVARRGGSKPRVRVGGPDAHVVRTDSECDRCAYSLFYYACSDGSNAEWGPRNDLSCMKIGKKTEEKRISREIY